MRYACLALLLTAAVTEAKKNKDADRHLEQALLKESASYIDEAIEMGAVRVPPARPCPCLLQSSPLTTLCPRA